jgi:hypothetical protein
MTKDPGATRRARLQRECDVSAVPAWLLLAACAALVLVLGPIVPIGETQGGPSAQPTQTAPSPMG